MYNYTETDLMIIIVLNLFFNQVAMVTGPFVDPPPPHILKTVLQSQEAVSAYLWSLMLVQH